MITVQQAIELIIQELRSAQKQHPLFPTDPIHELQKEIIQTGAMAVRNLINFHHFNANTSPQVEG